MRFCVAKLYVLRLICITSISEISFQIVEDPIVPTPPPAFDSNDILRMLDEGGNEFINLTEKMVTGSSHVFTNSESTNFFTIFFEGLQSVSFFFC